MTFPEASEGCQGKNYSTLPVKPKKIGPPTLDPYQRLTARLYEPLFFVESARADTHPALGTAPRRSHAVADFLRIFRTFATSTKVAPLVFATGFPPQTSSTSQQNPFARADLLMFHCFAAILA